MLPHTCVTLSRTSLCSACRWWHTSGCGLRFALRIKRVRCRFHHLGSFFFVFWVLGRQQYCLFGSAVHVPTHSFDRADAFEVGEGALSKLVSWQRLRLSWILFRVVVGQACTYTIQKLARLACYPRLLSVRPGRQISAGNAALLCVTELGSACCFLKKTIKLVCSVIVQPADAMTPSVVATTECMPTWSRPWFGMDPSEGAPVG